MYTLKGYLNLKSGTVQTDRITLTDTEQENGVRAVYINGVSRERLNSEFGAGIDIMLEDITAWTSICYPGAFWCVPKFGADINDIPDNTQCLIYKKENGVYGVIFPVVSENYKCVLLGGDNAVTAKLYTLYDDLFDCKGLAFVYAESNNPYELLRNCAKTGMKLLNNTCRTIEERRYPEIFEYLGWCSWDAMEIRVNEEDLVRKCTEFNDKNIPVKWAIIDDMWGHVEDFYNQEYKDRTEMFALMHSSKLYSFKADPKRFPNGLKACIEKMNEKGIEVGMWHPISGYWRGIAPDGEIYRNHKEHIIKSACGDMMPDYKQEHAYAYYDAWHDYFDKCGVKFVKIDNQSQLNVYYRGMAPIGQIARESHAAMESSVGRHFDNQMINCMGMASEDMWNRSVSPISRCSGDFQPENKAWFTNHIMQCSYNDLMQGQFYYCDWDMWWTDDGQALKNSILRAISGGPIYVSDKLERSNRDILMPLVLEDGRILRCDKPAMPTADCIFENPTESGKLFKIQNTCNGSGVMAVFNLDEADDAVTGTISPSDVDGLQGDRFAVYEHFSRELKVLDYNEGFDLTLSDGDEFRLYIIAPITDGFAAIGRTDKLISPATVKCVLNEEILLTEPGEYAYVKNEKLYFKNSLKEEKA